MKIDRNALLICVAQILGIMSLYGFWLVYRFLMKQPYLPIKPYLIIISPPLVAITVSFVLSSLLPLKVDFKRAIFISVPATLVYFSFYILVPYVVINFNAEVLPFFCCILVPITMATIILNGLAIWLGSLLHVELVKRKQASAVRELENS